MSGGAVPVVDVSRCSDARSLADAIQQSLSTVGFLFIVGHGMEEQAEEMFKISEHFFKNESFEEKQRCAYVEPTFFTSQHGEGPDSTSILRFLHYPAIPAGSNVEPNRAGAHSDYGSLTLLFQRKDGGEGLQLLPSTEPIEGGKWRDTGVVENALLVNIGDAMELWSGANFKSTLHRVRAACPLPLWISKA
ncbi:SPOSA6832_04085, partial [Sporobolomyces salmonicolor]